MNTSAFLASPYYGFIKLNVYLNIIVIKYVIMKNKLVFISSNFLLVIIFLN